MNSFRVDLRVLGFTVAISLLASLLFGLGPAIRSSRFEVDDLMARGGGRGATERRDLGGPLILSEVALATMLLIGAAISDRSTLRLLRMDRNLDTPARTRSGSVFGRIFQEAGPTGIRSRPISRCGSSRSRRTFAKTASRTAIRRRCIFPMRRIPPHDVSAGSDARPAARLGGGRAPPDSGSRSGRATFRREDPRRDYRTEFFSAERFWRNAGRRRGAGSAVGGDGDPCVAGVVGIAAYSGDRNSNGDRRNAIGCGADGARPGAATSGHGHYGRDRRGRSARGHPKDVGGSARITSIRSHLPVRRRF